MNINFYSCVYGVKTFLPVLLTQDDPGIINVDSSAALMTLAGTSMYSSSKAVLKVSPKHSELSLGASAM